MRISDERRQRDCDRTQQENAWNDGTQNGTEDAIARTIDAIRPLERKFPELNPKTDAFVLPDPFRNIILAKIDIDITPTPMDEEEAKKTMDPIFLEAARRLFKIQNKLPFATTIRLQVQYKKKTTQKGLND